jgi:hypothetical protein
MPATALNMPLMDYLAQKTPQACPACLFRFEEANGLAALPSDSQRQGGRFRKIRHKPGRAPADYFLPLPALLFLGFLTFRC